LLALLAALTLFPFEGKSSVPSQGLYLLMIFALIGSVIRWPLPLLTAQPFVHWGRISYGMYMMHMFAIIAVRKYIHPAPALTFLFAVAGVTLMATLSHKYFEAPIIAFSKKRLAVRRLAPRIQPVVRPEPQPALNIAVEAG
jgi:peptidoglycan/LPS O-acetylase OafA/YrhL